MPSYLSSVHSSRVRKPGQPSTLRRHSTQPFSSAQRTKPTVQRAKTIAEQLDHDSNDDSDGEADGRLDAVSAPTTVMQVATATDILSAMKHASEIMFCPIPDRAGMNSTRIAEALNFHKNLPPLVSLAHIHALLSASSKTERDINALLSANTIRRIKLLGRGNDVSGVADSLITTTALNILLNQSNLPQHIITSFLALLSTHPHTTTFSPQSLPPAHLTALTRAGFLVSTSTYTRSLSLAGQSSHVATPTIARASSGSSSAIGGPAAFEELGGTSTPSTSSSTPLLAPANLLLSLPNIGVWARLLAAGRSHLVDLLSKSPYKEAPMYLLRERWDGAVDGEGSVSKAKNVRGEFASIMPARTRKWKKLWGMRFEWALEECLGAGLVEVFETGSVGLGVRCVGR